MTTPDSTEVLDESWHDGVEPAPRPVLPREPLMSRSFLSLLAVQFLTVLNDNTFRWLVVPLA